MNDSIFTPPSVAAMIPVGIPVWAARLAAKNPAAAEKLFRTSSEAGIQLPLVAEALPQKVFTGMKKQRTLSKPDFSAASIYAMRRRRRANV